MRFLSAGSAYLYTRYKNTRLVSSRRSCRSSMKTGLGLSVKMEGLSRRRARFGRIAVGSSRHRIQQLLRILEVALPEQRRTLAGQAIGCVGCHAVVGDGHACGRWRSPLRAPARGASLACLDPVHKWWPAHDNTVRAIIGGRRGIPEFIFRLGIW